MPPLKNRKAEREKLISDMEKLNRPKDQPVRLKDGIPSALFRHGKWVAVEEILDRWRVDDTWWREPLTRMYFEVLLENGAVEHVFHDRVHNTWHIQRYTQPPPPTSYTPPVPDDVAVGEGAE